VSHTNSQKRSLTRSISWDFVELTPTLRAFGTSRRSFWEYEAKRSGSSYDSLPTFGPHSCSEVAPLDVEAAQLRKRWELGERVILAPHLVPRTKLSGLGVGMTHSQPSVLTPWQAPPNGVSKRSGESVSGSTKRSGLGVRMTHSQPSVLARAGAIANSGSRSGSSYDSLPSSFLFV
jgi:hypothetical protein